MPPGLKHNLSMFCSAVWDGSTSSRYFGTPPVTERTLSFSEAATFFPLQNMLQAGSASGGRCRFQEQRPAKPVLFRMFACIQEETDPQRTRISLVCCEN